MRRSVLIATTIGSVAVCAGSALAAPAGSRSVAMTYTLATSAAAPTGTVMCCGVGIDNSRFGMVWAATHAGDRTVSVRIADHEIGSVAAIVEATTNNSWTRLGTICGSSSKPFTLGRHVTGVLVRPAYGICGTSASAPTSGTVTFRFNR
jgi:hypothetical protein